MSVECATAGCEKPGVKAYKDVLWCADCDVAVRHEDFDLAREALEREESVRQFIDRETISSRRLVDRVHRENL